MKILIKMLFRVKVGFIMLVSISTYSQEVFEYEQRLENLENFIATEFQFDQKVDNLKFSGLLLTPKTNYDKVVIIIPGAGKDTRNSHHILTSELLKNNIAVFRFDDRGTGKSEGDFNKISYVLSNKINDAAAAINFIKNLPSLSNKKIGVIGHSEGGLSSIGALEKGSKIDFLVQWATPVEKHGAFLKYQLKTGINKQDKGLQFPDVETKITVMDLIHRIIEENKNDSNEILTEKINNSLKAKGYKKKQFEWYFTFPSYKDLLRKNFEETYKTIAIPTLYIIGSHDNFVDPTANINLLDSFNNRNIETKLFTGLNHYLTKDEISLTKRDLKVYDIDNSALIEIVNWIMKV